RGVGHFAKAAEKMAFTNGDVVDALLQINNQVATQAEIAEKGKAKSIDLLMNKPRRVYDTPNKGILWGWEVSGYVLTKAIAAGVFLVLFAGLQLGYGDIITAETKWQTLGAALVFLMATGALLVKDLDQPGRFLYVLLRPHWSSWLVRGGYAITVFGGLLTLWGLTMWFGWDGIQQVTLWATAVLAVIAAIYTAFLFAQAKGRDFWQSPALAIHMLTHSFMAGAAALLLLGAFAGVDAAWTGFLKITLAISIVVGLFTMLAELATTHPTTEAKLTVETILKGRYRMMFWIGAVLIGNIAPLAILILGGLEALPMAVAGALALVGIWFTEKIWVEAPQRIPLT
ncbi:MAG TPA: polysulfide reductase NrfD, partial [Flavilitoribacter sp.]|nr:polysulfide reductase NrfD [Flavilitoribacter sp.]